MLTNRTKRILFPFLAGVFLICPFVNVSFTYSQLAFMGDSHALTKAFGALANSFPPASTDHLWFLYFLVLYILMMWPLSAIFKNLRPTGSMYSPVFKSVMQNFWSRFLFVTSVFFLFLFWMHDAFIATSKIWLIYMPPLLMYFFFFLLGWGIFKTDCLQYSKQHPILQISIGSLLVLVFAFAPWPSNAAWVLPAQQVLSAVFSTLLIFGFIASFLTYFNRFSPTLNYLMDAAYWVYIIHLPIVSFIPGLLAGTDFSLIAKFLIVLLTTMSLCFLSYHLFVRNTFIGIFLNGKVHKKKKVADDLSFPQPQFSK